MKGYLKRHSLQEIQCVCSCLLASYILSDILTPFYPLGLKIRTIMSGVLDRKCCVVMGGMFYTTHVSFWLLFVGAWCFANAVEDHQHVNFSSSLRVVGCDLSRGSWVHDATYPLYNSRSCPFMKPEFDCQKYGRPDSDYLRWRWSPHGCQVPRLNGAYLLRKLRGKTLMFVGDSLDENQWYSMICLLHASAPGARYTFDTSGLVFHFKIPELGVTVNFQKAQYLVDLVSKVVNGQKRRVLQLDSVAINSMQWKYADILVFNSGHWWLHTGQNTGYDLFEEGNQYFANMDHNVAYRKGLTTWANWVNTNINPRNTKVFFRSASPFHGTLPGGKNCYSSKEPLSSNRISDVGSIPEQYYIARNVVKTTRSKANFLDVTAMSMLRPDAHPSVYNGALSSVERLQPLKYADCSHWCAPGVPDIWNELLYSQLV